MVELTDILKNVNARIADACAKVGYSQSHLRQISLGTFFLIFFPCVCNQKLLFLFQSAKQRFFLFAWLFLFRRCGRRQPRNVCVPP